MMMLLPLPPSSFRISCSRRRWWQTTGHALLVCSAQTAGVLVCSADTARIDTDTKATAAVVLLTACSRRRQWQGARDLSTDTGTDANCCHCRHHLLGSHAPTLTATPKPLLPPPPPPRLMPSVSSAVAVVECLCARHRRSHRCRHRRHHGHRSSISSFLWPAALAAAEDRSVECW